jgi:hypothetical protein
MLGAATALGYPADAARFARRLATAYVPVPVPAPVPPPRAGVRSMELQVLSGTPELARPLSKVAAVAPNRATQRAAVPDGGAVLRDSCEDSGCTSCCDCQSFKGIAARELVRWLNSPLATYGGARGAELRAAVTKVLADSAAAVWDNARGQGAYRLFCHVDKCYWLRRFFWVVAARGLSQTVPGPAEGPCIRTYADGMTPIAALLIHLVAVYEVRRRGAAALCSTLG